MGDRNRNPNPIDNHQLPTVEEATLAMAAIPKPSLLLLRIGGLSFKLRRLRSSNYYVHTSRSFMAIYHVLPYFTENYRGFPNVLPKVVPGFTMVFTMFYSCFTIVHHGLPNVLHCSSGFYPHANSQSQTYRPRPKRAPRRFDQEGLVRRDLWKNELVVTCCNMMIIKLLCTKVYNIVIYIY